MIKRMNINRLTYSVKQVGHGNALLMLHGFTGSQATWHTLEITHSAHYQVIAPDLIGHGQTDAPTDPTRYVMKQAAADLIALLDALQIKQTHLLGYSMGGRLALYIARHYTDRIHTLTLESSSPGLPTQAEREERRNRDNALADRIEREGITAFVDFWQSIPLWESQKTTLSDEAQAQLRTERLSQRPHGLANSLRGMGTGVQPSLWDDLSTLNIPVQLIAGEYDAKFIRLTQQMANLLPTSQLDIIPKAGHTAHLENPAVFNEILQGFLANHTR